MAFRSQALNRTTVEKPTARNPLGLEARCVILALVCSHGYCHTEVIRKDFVNERKFAHLHKACGKSLDRLQNECRQTLNLLASVTHFPLTMEKRTALDFQCQ